MLDLWESVSLALSMGYINAVVDEGVRLVEIVVSMGKCYLWFKKVKHTSVTGLFKISRSNRERKKRKKLYY